MLLICCLFTLDICFDAGDAPAVHAAWEGTFLLRHAMALKVYACYFVGKSYE